MKLDVRQSRSAQEAEFKDVAEIQAHIKFFQELDRLESPNQRQLVKLWKSIFGPKSAIDPKDKLVAKFKKLESLDLPEGADLPHLTQIQSKIQLKPVRTVSGVTPVTVLTKPFPCPGKCIFCPNDVRMPKSYLSDEPGAQRAERNGFDPYLQTFSRLNAFQAIGHDTSKVEIIVLGGTWSFYPETYQIWFIKRIFQALNDFSSGNQDEYNTLLQLKSNPEHRNLSKNEDIIRNTQVHIGDATYNQIISAKLAKEHLGTEETATWEELEAEHTLNASAKARCVGLVIETRPDKISPQEVVRIRRLGCTKTQIGFQSLNDEVLEKNHRGHDVQATREAVKLLRWAGFKIHAHWMANLYGSNPQQDIQDYDKLFSDQDFRPDELKVYPCSLIETAELMDYYNQGLWKPYSYQELLSVIIHVLSHAAKYCRLTRVIRDIPGTDIVVGNKTTNFRQLAEQQLQEMNIEPSDIRGREIQNLSVDRKDLILQAHIYHSSIGTEIFLEFVTQTNQIAGFLRLSLPNTYLKEDSYKIDTQDVDLPTNLSQNIQTTQGSKFEHPFIPELSNSSMIREIHIYGKTSSVGQKDPSKAQHLGLGTELIGVAQKISMQAQYQKMAVISAIGTREYYQKRGFELDGMYQVKTFLPEN